jgi:hypothetical protein
MKNVPGGALAKWGTLLGQSFAGWQQSNATQLAQQLNH